MFIRRVNSEVAEKFLGDVSVKDVTTSIDIKGVIKCMKDHQLDLKKVWRRNRLSTTNERKKFGGSALIPRYMKTLKECSSSEKEKLICHCLLR